MVELDATDGTGASGLPAVTCVRPHAEGGAAVVVAFENGARLRYRDREDGVVETVVSPGGDRLTHERDLDGPHEAALRSLAAYLSFGDRERARFVWGAATVETLLGERERE